LIFLFITLDDYLYQSLIGNLRDYVNLSECINNKAGLIMTWIRVNCKDTWYI